METEWTTTRRRRMKKGIEFGGVTAALVMLAAAACTGDTVVDPGEEVPAGAVALAATEVFSVQNAWSGFQETTRMLIRDEDAWATAWKTLHAHVSPTPARPVIDFGSNAVVLAAMGTRPTGGYSVTIEDVHAHGGALYVSVVERSPGPTCATLQAITAPVHAVQVAREGSTAHFHVETITVSC
jgi:hypothetical protein